MNTNANTIEILRQIQNLIDQMADELEKLGTLETIKPITKTFKTSNDDLETQIADTLKSLGMPAHIKGYQYVRTAIILKTEEPDEMYSVTKRLYPAIAEEYNTTPSRVERAIRHAIEVAWDRGNVEVLHSYFGYTIEMNRGKPTNSEFIAMLADKLRLERKME